jgi:hypothetical protein
MDIRDLEIAKLQGQIADYQRTLRNILASMKEIVDQQERTIERCDRRRHFEPSEKDYASRYGERRS